MRPDSSMATRRTNRERKGCSAIYGCLGVGSADGNSILRASSHLISFFFLHLYLSSDLHSSSGVPRYLSRAGAQPEQSLNDSTLL